MDKLNLGEKFIKDESIESYELHEYTSDRTILNKSGEIRFTINQQDTFLDISESYLQFEGQLVKNDDTEYKNDGNVALINNALMYLKDNIVLNDILRKTPQNILLNIITLTKLPFL